MAGYKSFTGIEELRFFAQSAKIALTTPALAFSAALDLGFLFLAGFFSAFITPFIDYHATSLHQIVAGSIQAAGPGTQAPSIVQLIFQEISLPYLVGVVFWLLVQLAVVYALYVVLSGTAWWIALKRASVKISWKGYAANFAWLNVRWFTILSVLWLIFTMVDVRAVAIESATGNAASRIYHWIVGIAAIIIAYAMAVSYGLVSKNSAQQSFRTSWKTCFTKKRVAVTGIILALLFVIVQYGSGWLIGINRIAGLVVGTALLAILLFLTRISMARAARYGIHEQP